MTAGSMFERLREGSAFDVESDVEAVRARREEIAYDALAAIWRGKWRIALAILLADLIAIAWLVVATPKYASTAVVEFGFGSVPTMTSGSEQGVDANSVVESAAHILRSRDLAESVVASLHLDADPEFARTSRLDAWLVRLRERLKSIADGRAEVPPRLRAALQATLSMPDRPAPTARELAANELMRKVAVVHEPHTYLIYITATTGEPTRSAAIANALAGRYLDLERRLDFETRRDAAERQVNELSARLGDAHPTAVRAKAQLSSLDDVHADGAASPNEGGSEPFVAGRLVHPGDPLDLPTSPNPKATLQAASAAGLLAGLALALLGARKPRRRVADHGG